MLLKTANAPSRRVLADAVRAASRLSPRFAVARPRSAPPTALKALTAAALTLPGIAPAESSDRFEFQYGHYEEGGRAMFDERSKYQPITVDSLATRGDIRLRDDLTLHVEFSQDTWSGATPIASAPLATDGNRGSISNDTNSGASPYIYSGMAVDARMTPYVMVVSPTTFTLVPEKRVAHTMASASPETRRAGDFALAYDVGLFGASLGGGLSVEDDFEAHYASLGLRRDFNRKRTTVELGARYAHSDIAAKLDGDAYHYFESHAYADRISFENTRDTSTRTLRDVRHDWSLSGGVSQVINKHVVVESGLEFTRTTGYQENPYKVTQFLFFDPLGAPIDFGLAGVPPVYDVQMRALLEQRPDLRQQWSWHGRMVADLERLNAAAHVGYRFYHDDWDISAHTFDLEWIQRLPASWSVVPRMRYYSQSRADFYHPYVLLRQAVRIVDIDPNDPSAGFREDYSTLPLNYFSSDHRLSGFGALSGGVSVAREMAGGALRLEAGAEYYVHAGRLKLGGGGERAFADFDGYLLNASLKLDLDRHLFDGMTGDAHHHVGQGGAGLHARHGGQPAGLDYVHRLDRAGEFMAGYRYSYAQWSGDLLHGSHASNAAQQLNQACGAQQCSTVPREMSMNMHMLDLMYAPRAWLTLFLMPQFVDTAMSFEKIAGAPPASGHHHGGAGDGTHASGGVGDSEAGALLRVFDDGLHSAHVGLALRVPSGDYKQRHGDARLGDYLHYDMQLGSGTWDLAPSATWLGQYQRWSWGAQLAAVVRLEGANGAGYRLGDRLTTSLWSGYALSDWLSATLRGSHALQGGIHGAFKPAPAVSGPMDRPDNSGGRYWDLGAGLSALVPHGALAGNRLSLEWLAPLGEHVNGYQRERAGTLFARWSVSL